MALSPLFDIYDPEGEIRQRIGTPMGDADILGVIPIRKRQPQVADLLPEEEKTTLLRQLANAGSSGLSLFGWALDTPGAVVRGLLSGGPGKALSALWEDSEQRVTGRELARQYGLTGSEDNWRNFAGGMLAEIALDPLSYVGIGLLGRGAKTAAAKTAEKAGLMAGDIGLLAKQKNMGTAQFLRESTPQTLIDMAGDAAEQAAAKAKWEEYAGAAAEELLGQPLARTNRISIPGMVEGSADLYGKTAGDWLAKTSDKLGDYARAAPVLGPVVRGAQAIFDPRVMGFTDEKGQYIARRITEGQRRELARVRQDIADNMVDAAFDIPDNIIRKPEFAKAVRDVLENQTSQVTDPEIMRALQSDGGRNLLMWMRQRMDDELARAKELGIPLEKENLPNDIFWFPRQQAEIDRPRYADGYQPKVNRSRKGSAIGGVREGGTASRRDYNRAFPAWVLDKMAQDPALQKRLREATNAEWFADNAPGVIDDWLARNVPDWNPAGGPFGFLADQFEGDELLKRTQDMYVGLADSLRRTPLQAAEQGIPKFGNSLNDFSSYLMNRGRMRANANSLLDFISDDFKRGGYDVLLQMAESVPGGTHIALPDALKALGFTEDAVQSLANRMGRDADTLSRMSMSKDLVDRLNERMVTARTPREAEGLLKNFQNFTDSFKTLALASPARHLRDAYSGAFASATRDGFSPTDWLTGARVAGGDYAGLSKRLQNAKGYRVEDLFPGDVVVGKPGASLPAGYTLVTEEQLAEARARKFLKAAGGQGLTSGTVADDLGRQATNLQMNEAFPGAAGGLFRNVRDKPWLSWQTWNPFATRGRTSNPNFLLDLSDRAASFTDAGNRLGTFLNRVRKGDSPEAAKALTDLTQVLYGPENFTSFERDFLTKIFPFYRFQKGITPFVAKELVERPYGLTGQSMRAINRGSEPSEDQFTPEYLRQSAAIPVDASSIFGVKTPGVQRFLTNIDLPHESLLNLFTPGIGNNVAQRVSDSLMKTGSNILGQANPLLKGPLESVLNRQFYSGRQLSDLYSMLEHDLGSLSPYLGSWGRMAEQIAVNAPGGSRVLGLMRQLRDNRISPAERAAKLAFNTLTGMKFQDVDQDKTLRLAARTTLNQLLDAAPGVSTYENLFIKPEDLARLSEPEQRQYLLYRVLQSEAAKRARDKKKQAEDPLAILGVDYA